MFSRRTRPETCLVVAVLAVSLSSCGSRSETEQNNDDFLRTSSEAIAAPVQKLVSGDFAAPAQDAPRGSSTGTDKEVGIPHPSRVPGLGAEMSARIPQETRQVLVASAPDAESETGTLSFYSFEDDEWKKLKTFDFHNGRNGWLENRREGDKTTPIGVFTLSDAGGFKADPGTKLPYTQDSQLPSSATVAYGAEYSRVFDYVIAIDYNRATGKPPTDRTRPQGWDKGGGIWLHLDHGAGTNGCVTLTEKDLRWILRTIDPEAQPHIAMGPVSELEK